MYFFFFCFSVKNETTVDKNVTKTVKLLVVQGVNINVNGIFVHLAFLDREDKTFTSSCALENFYWAFFKCFLFKFYRQ